MSSRFLPLSRSGLVLVLLVTLIAASCGDAAETASAPSMSEPPSTAVRAPNAARSPVWPEGSTSAAAAAIANLQSGQDASRTAPEATAQRFAREVLGWATPQVQRDPTRASDATTVWLRVTGGTKAATASVEVMPLTDDRRLWAVAYARLADGDDENFNVSVRVSGNIATVSAAQGWWTNEVASAELRIGHGLGERVFVATNRPARWNDVALPEPPTDTGHLILIFRSSDGQAVTFLAIALPMGDFVAG
ncbi:MAG: hypothetical protein ABI658_17760 [Acidimicrobiales bacterium]